MDNTIGTHFSVRFFMTVLVTTILLLAGLGIYDYQAEHAIRDLKEHSVQIEKFRSEIIRLDEVLTMSARMAAATGDIQWEAKYKDSEERLSTAIQQAITLSPEIYRRETDRTNISKIKLLDMEHQAFELIRSGRGKEAMGILFGKQYEQQKNNYVHAIERLNVFLNKQMEAAMAVENSKEYLARISFITVLVLLLLSWLMILRITRQFQEALIQSNAQLVKRTRELDDLTRTLDQKVQDRTRDLQNVQGQLLQSEKFSAIGQLAAGVAHEINNPIGFINSNLQTMEKYATHYKQLLGILNQLEEALKNKDNKEVTQIVLSWEKIRTETNFAFMDGDIGNLLKESRDGAEKIRKIIQDLRAFASPDKGMVEAVNVETLMESTLNIVWNEIKYKAELKRDYGHVPAIVCNPQKISQVFVNLLINAAHAIKDKGRIAIKTYMKDDYICTDITDTGCGISPENIGKVFDPFFTTKPAERAVGLGLSISYDIIRKHGGLMTFISRLDQGTTFTIMLPMGLKESL